MTVTPVVGGVWEKATEDQFLGAHGDSEIWINQNHQWDQVVVKKRFFRGGWFVSVKSWPYKSKTVATAKSKKEALRKAKKWMRKHKRFPD